MLRSNQQFDEIRIVGGIAERTGNTAGRSAIRGRQNVCRSMSELARKQKLYMRDAAYVIAISRVAQACEDRGWI